MVSTVSLVSLVPSSVFKESREKERDLLSSGNGYISTISEAKVAPVSSLMSSTAFINVGMQVYGLIACLNFVAASVEIPSLMEVFLMDVLSKLAHSSTILFVLSST